VKIDLVMIASWSLFLPRAELLTVSLSGQKEGQLSSDWENIYSFVFLPFPPHKKVD